jgi:hypothetical protein
MSSTNPKSRKFLKGALVKLDMIGPVPVPQVIIFQYNPENVTRTVTPKSDTGSTDGGAAATAPQTAQPQPPSETINFDVQFDAADALESPESHPVAMLTGVADRLAALEMLLYPSTSGNGLLGDLAGSLGLGDALPTPPERQNLPLTFFIWGPGRILPVKITEFTVTEKEFNTALYPIRVKIAMKLAILREGDYPADSTNSASADLANFAWKFYRTQQQVLAVANIANSVESILGMLPF